MTTLEKRVFNLSVEQAAFIDAQVSAGAFATESDVVQVGLCALQERDAPFERWLREEVAATYDCWKADPGGGLSSEEMAERMRKHHEARLKSGV